VLFWGILWLIVAVEILKLTAQLSQTGCHATQTLLLRNGITVKTLIFC